MILFFLSSNSNKCEGKQKTQYTIGLQVQLARGAQTRDGVLRDCGEGPVSWEGRDGRRGARLRAHGEAVQMISASSGPSHSEAAQGPVGGEGQDGRRTHGEAAQAILAARSTADDEARTGPRQLGGPRRTASSRRGKGPS